MLSYSTPSMLTGKIETCQINTNLQEIAVWDEDRELALYQACPSLSEEERLFVMSGMSMEEYAQYLKAGNKPLDF